MSRQEHDTIVVLDFGGQYAHLIAKRIRGLEVYCEILPPSAGVADLDRVKGIILSGGPSSVYSPDQPPYNSKLLDMGIPMLGLCYGHHILAKHFGGGVARGDAQEYGAAELEITQPIGVLEGLKTVETVWMSHGDSVDSVPDGFEAIAKTSDCPVAAMGDPLRGIFGLQFHPEVTHTPSGNKILDQFLNVCGARRTWTMRTFAQDSVAAIREHVGDRRVFLFVSGGVDSTVAFVLLNEAIGKENVVGLHIDNGFMRLGESEFVDRTLRDNGFDNLHTIDASETFLAELVGVIDPQEKREVIGQVFMDVQFDQAGRFGLDVENFVVGLGTLYPDIIESGGSDHADVIKTHHNRVDIIHDLIAEGKVVEPLDQLYKDEVRQVGRQLGLPETLVARHPFPGPGLAVRCLCSSGQNAAVDGLVTEQVAVVAKTFGYDSAVLPIQSVGVQGDARTYSHPAVLVGPQDWQQLELASTAITNHVADVNRVLYLLAPDSMPTLEPIEAHLTRERLDRLRKADALTMAHLEEEKWMSRIFQMPTILVPLSSNGSNESVILRPLESDDVMTARFAPVPNIGDLVKAIMDENGSAAVFFDATHKPPGTIEWE
ncbi:MAG: glutamine-hydrolyzing GMP synthase [Candidatus Latescibacteria bacterium]|nr:glutamine-hydrolyzing GMP synthase [Candidatus Latescibacterota bacterium]